MIKKTLKNVLLKKDDFWKETEIRYISLTGAASEPGLSLNNVFPTVD